MKRRALWAFFAAVAAASTALSQETGPIETLIQGEVDHTLVLEPLTRFSTVGGSFANFTGMSVGLGLNDRFFLGVGGVGLTNRTAELEMGYGGLIVSYTHRPNRLLHWTVSSLIGGGELTARQGASRTLFVAEPEVGARLNVTESFRLKFGVGYRFVGNTQDSDPDAGGLSGSFGVVFRFLGN